MKTRKSNKKYKYKKGQKIDHITILSDDFVYDNGRYKLHYACDCGNEELRREDLFLKRKLKTCSKCSKKNNYPERRKSRMSFVNGIHSRILYKIQQDAKRRNIEYLITTEELLKKFSEQFGKCPYTGIKLQLLNISMNETNASLDRIDSKLPYTYDNVEWVFKPINIMKNAFSKDEFVNVCFMISKNLRQF